MDAVIQPDKVLRELDELWVTLGKQENADSAAILRACSMTLVVATDEGRDDAGVGETLALIMRDHPSRAIVIRVPPQHTGGLDARVLAQCWMPFGKRQQICCEQIEILTDSKGLLDVAPVVRTLRVADLPVMLWCRASHLLDLPDFQPVLEFSTKLIVDSGGIADLEGQVALLQRSRSAGRQVGDLAWTRLTRWRESIAQIFDNPVYLARVHNIREVHLDYEGSHTPMSACYLAAWFTHVLERELSFTFRRSGDAPRARVHTVAVRGEGLDVSIAVGQDRAVEMHAGVRDTHTVFPKLSEYELLREELSIPGRDPIYDEVLGRTPEFIRLATSSR